ncbi:HNH endonuclease [Natrialba swarupiae]|uniref:HNH endonuclease n=1 Tax=Natrialba swarupiae TaxID=2448032 RepID=A0A5D5AQM2_9EURY|nr:HNH endonuclease [Natrialba swarupiae]
MRSTTFEQAVFDRWGCECVVCGRRPEEWLDTDLGDRNQDKLSFHHVNGNEDDDRVENVIPVCQSCHVHIHRRDKPPYRKWHRQLPLKHRHAWNAHHHEYYEGPRLTREEAERRFGDDEGTPESVKYLEHEREDFALSAFTSTPEDKSKETAGTGSNGTTTDTDDTIANGGNERDELTDSDDVDTESNDPDTDDDTGGDLDD